MKINTTKRTSIWAVQVYRERSGWSTLEDRAGIITMKTRKIARNIAREYRNVNPDMVFRVIQLIADTSKRNR